MAFGRLQSFVARRPRQTVERSNQLLPVLLILAVGVAASTGLFFATRQWEYRENQAEFDYAAMHPAEAIRRAIERIELTHEAMRQNYYGSSYVSRAEFSLCAEPFLARVPSLKVLQWAPRVPQSDRGAFEQRAQHKGWPNYRIIEPDSLGQLVPAKPRDEYFPIWYAATKSGFEARFGWDFGADPVLRTVIDKCRDTGQFEISEMISLSNIGLSDRVVQTFLPLYRQSRTVRTIADRRARFDGLLVGLCQIDDLVNSAVSYASGPQGIDLALFDESAPADRRLLYFHPSRTRSDEERESMVCGRSDPAGIHHTESLLFGGRRWALVCTPAPGFFAANRSWRSWTILAGGLLLTLMAAAYSRAAVTRRQRIERIVDQRTAELRARDGQLRQAHEETIQRLATASLCRDEETGMHIRRTGLLSEALALAAGWSKSDAEIIRLAAPMHDVGKIGIPDAILQKPGKLTPDEFEIMKTHTSVGARMLDGSQSAILHMARDIALCHHERWDGKGYPRGLRGEAIPEPARILSIVDVYDALSHDRVYRPALPEDEVLAIMQQGSGTQFEPLLLAVFLAHFDEMRRIAGENPDELESEPGEFSLLPPVPILPPVQSAGPVLTPVL